MSSTNPLRPLMPVSNPSTSSRSPNPSLLSGQHAQIGERNLASSSASSSQAVMSDKKRVDQVIYRLYLKTVNVLVDGRLTHTSGSSGPGQASASEKKQDKWFNLSLPDTDLYRSDLALYRHVSSYQPYSEQGISTPSPESCTIPPLLIAFILDASDLPSGQALLWNRDGAKIPLNTNLLGNKGKGKEKERRTGIILEKWTLRAKVSTADSASTSQAGPHIAYRLGIIHFRALYSLIRLLPTYRLYRRLRRANNGIRMGLKLWAPEGYPNTLEGLAEAWEVMERGLVGLDTGLDELISGEEVEPEEIQRYELPKLDLFGNEYSLSVDYRPEVDFNVEDMEAVLSEKFVDMDEDWFKPTVARSNSRAENESAPSSADSRSVPSVSASRKSAGPTPIPSTQSPIPQRQQALHPGSLISAGGGSLSGSKPRSGPGSRVPSSQRDKTNVGSVGTDRWTPLAEGLPFAGPSSSMGQGDGQSQQPPSPSMATPAAILAARRLSGHSIQPFASASPSASLLRSTPPQQYQSGAPVPAASTSVSARPVIGGSRPSSIGRTSSFLSQSGRSYTHAQIANMYAGSASPPVTGAMSGIGVHIPASSPVPGQSPVSPSSLSFTKQPVPRSISGRPFYITPSGSSPFIPGSLEKEPSSVSSATGQPGIIKRYSSSLSQRSGRAITSTGVSTGVTGSAIAGSQGSSADGSPSVGQSLLRRTSTRESGLRHSLEGPTSGSVSGSSSRLPAPDEEDIQAFLKTLDALPQPPSLAAQAAQSSRSHLPSTSSSLSTPSAGYQPSPSTASISGSPGAPYHGRAPVTRQQVDDELRRLAGSFSLSSQVFSGVESPPRSRPSASTSMSTGPSSIGLLSASRPNSAARRASNFEAEQGTAQGPRPLYRRQTSGGRSPLGPGGTASPPAVVPGISSGSSASASPMKALRSADEIVRHTGSRFTSSASGTSVRGGAGSGAGVGSGVGAARSLPGTGTAHPPLNEEEPLPLRSAGAGPHQPGLPHSVSTGIISPQTTGGTTATHATNADSVRSRRGPVLLRGGFGDPSAVSRSSAASTPSHSPVRDLGLGRGVGLGINRAAVGAGEGQAQGQGYVQPGSSIPCRGSSISGHLRSGFGEDDENGNGQSSWRGTHTASGTNTAQISGLGRRASSGLGGPGISGYPGLPLSSTAAGSAAGGGNASIMRGKERRTAPSSLGRDRDQHLQGEGEGDDSSNFGQIPGIGIGVGPGRNRNRRVGSDVGVGVVGSRLSEESELSGEFESAVRGLNSGGEERIRARRESDQRRAEEI
ncbi:hypothetical protein I316_06539 [Kwoniella heveanensis BCC8398]|uniref:Autophagy-related protein 13 n=1 Tax=Kwoniella heveanensis BCC8398 TaxID=1296120 RepID=A0A1B9GKU2_9TREE|nr:hypothetical protein I316_06539 [Kwoniella heveanensis BCC8398]